MPYWQPNWQDVRWDSAAAHEASAALRRMADFLEHVAAERSRRALAATEQWRGRYRDQFDVRADQLLKTARELAGRCRNSANNVLRADQAAQNEQRRRERERERWFAEKEAEERAWRRFW